MSSKQIERAKLQTWLQEQKRKNEWPQLLLEASKISPSLVAVLRTRSGVDVPLSNTSKLQRIALRDAASEIANELSRKAEKARKAAELFGRLSAC